MAAQGGPGPRTPARTWRDAAGEVCKEEAEEEEGRERKTGVPATVAVAVWATCRPAATFLKKDHTCAYSSLWKRDVGIEALRMVDSAEKRSVTVFLEQPKILEVEYNFVLHH